MPALRNAYFVLAALTLLLVAAQFLIAGLMIFEDRDFVDAHNALAGILHLLPLLMIICALVAKMGRDAALYAVVLLVLVTVQSGLPDATGAIAALHPLVALVIFVVAHMAFQRGRLWKAATPAPTTTPAA